MSVRWLEELNADSLPLAGSKIYRLAELARLDLTVPPGFVVTTEAYRDYLNDSGIEPEIDSLIASLSNARDVDALTDCAARIGELFERVPFGAALEHAIVQAYDQLCDRRAALALPVAVRSSATGEDAADASFAGQF